jgi:hypothetical protein
VPSSIAFILLSMAWAPVLVLAHELGHAFAALALTDGEVKIRMRPGLAILLIGECAYEPRGLRSPRAEAWIAAAGPAVTLLCAVILGWAALEATEGLARTGFGPRVLEAGAVCAGLQLLVTAVPMRYGRGLGEDGEESDGRAVWRILTGAPPGGLAREERRLGRPDRGVPPFAAVVLAAVVALTLYLDPLLAVALAGLFGLAFLLQRTAG